MIKSAPHSILNDAYQNKLFHKYVFFGNRNPLQKIKIAIAKTALSGFLKSEQLKK